MEHGKPKITLATRTQRHQLGRQHLDQAQSIDNSPSELRRWIREGVNIVEQTRGMLDDETRYIRHALIAELASKRQQLAQLEVC